MRHQLSAYSVMQSGTLSISELADAAGLSRRAVRFYVQQRLLPPPNGVGRGNHYDASHLARLTQILELQSAGHSLDAIRRILDGEIVAPASNRGDRPAMAAELWTWLRFMQGVELHFNASKHQPDAQKLIALRQAVQDIFLQAKTPKRSNYENNERRYRISHGQPHGPHRASRRTPFRALEWNEPLGHGRPNLRQS